MLWSITQAQHYFSNVIEQAAEEPQMIGNRDRLIAAVIDAETFERFQRWRQRHDPIKTLGEAFAELRQLTGDDENPLPDPQRHDRPHAFLEILDE